MGTARNRIRFHQATLGSMQRVAKMLVLVECQAELAAAMRIACPGLRITALVKELARILWMARGESIGLDGGCGHWLAMSASQSSLPSVRTAATDPRPPETPYL